MWPSTCSRRSFLHASAAAGLALGLSPVAHAVDEPATRPSAKIRWGIIGTGKRAMNAHIPALKSMAADCEVVAACDVRDEHLRRGVDALGGKVQGYGDYQQLLSNRDVDAVLIAAPNLLHHEMVLAALQAGKHVLCEKPMAIDYEQCKAMRKASEERPKQIVMYGMQLRYSQRYHELARLVASGKIGVPKYFLFAEFRGDWAGGDVWQYPDPKTGKLVNWRHRYAASGGTLAEKVCHYFDVLHWIAGASPSSVLCDGGISVYQDGRDTWDHATTTIEYDNGITAVHSLSMFAPNRLDLELLGDEGSLRMDDDGVTFAPRRKGKREKVAMPDEVGHGERGSVESAVVRMYEDFADCVRTAGKRPWMSADMAMASCRTAWLGERSSKEKRSVRWDEIA
jgi:predicted dehydrogenase